MVLALVLAMLTATAVTPRRAAATDNLVYIIPAAVGGVVIVVLVVAILMADRTKETELELVAGHDRAPEARAVERDDRQARTRPQAAARRVREQRTRLQQRLAEEHPGHDRTSREVAGEEWLVDGDALPRQQADAVFDADDPVDEQQRITMRKQAPDQRGIDGAVVGHARLTSSARRRCG